MKNIKLTLNLISFILSEKNSIEVSPFNEDVTMKDLKENRRQIEKVLRHKTEGIMMNFSSPGSFNLDSSERTCEVWSEIVEGDTSGGFRAEVYAKGTVFMPDEERVRAILKKNLESLEISSITFGTAVSTKEGGAIPDFRKRCYQKLQKEHLILAYDEEKGMTVELGDDKFLAVLVKDDYMETTVFTKYDFQFKKCMEEFSVEEFTMNLIE